MRCATCQFELAEGSKFCPECGTPTPVADKKICSTCGAKCELDSKFCPKCGTPFHAKHAAPMQLSPDAIQSFEPIKKHASILFADIKGSTSATSLLDPEDARNILAPVVEKMLKAVFQYNGTVIHTAGDGIVAIFGAPQALEDHALRACLAANFMQTQLNALPGGLKIRVGLNSGEILMDIVGNTQQHLEYDVTGAAVNLAARMEQTANPGCIQLTANMLALVEEAVEVRSVGHIEVKGFKDPIETYELEGIKDDSRLVSIKYRPSFIPFVGRDDVMRELNQLMEQALAGHGNMVSLEAEAGQGKSRIVAELLGKYTSSEVRIIFCGGFAHLSNVSRYPIVQLFRQLMDIKAQDSIEIIQQKISPFLEEDIAYAESAALELLDINANDSEWNRLDPKAKHNHVFLIGVSILRNASLKVPLALAIEDLHWVDDETEQFIDFLLRQIDHLRIFIIGTYRPGFHSVWLQKAGSRCIPIGPISEKYLKQVLDTVLGTHMSINSLKKDILHACAGNPFFMQEMISSLIENKTLSGTMGNYSLSTANFAKAIKLPESIFALLQTKIDKLPSDVKGLLQTAAVVGERFLYDTVERLSSTNSEITRSNINQLTREHYVFEVQLYPELEFSLNHALIQEVLYSTLLKSVRQKTHLKILELLEQLPENKKKKKSSS